MIEDFYKIALINMPIKQIMQLQLNSVILLKKKQVKFTKFVIKVHLGIYLHCIMPDELLNECNMITKDIRYQITDIREMRNHDILFMDVYGKIIGTKD